MRWLQTKGGKSRTIISLMLLTMLILFIMAIMIPQFSAYRTRSVNYQTPQLTEPYIPKARVRKLPDQGGLPSFNTEEYDRIRENRFKDTLLDPLSTFSIGPSFSLSRW